MIGVKNGKLVVTNRRDIVVVVEEKMAVTALSEKRGKFR
jgi:hypothetical protein